MAGMTALGSEFGLFRDFLRKYLLSIAVISISILVLLANRHRQDWLPYFSGDGANALLYYGLIPLCLGCILLRTHPLNLGLGLGDFRFWFPASALYLCLAIPLVYLVSQSTAMQAHYPPEPIDWWEYWRGMGLYLIGWEFLFRGFLLFGLKRDFGAKAILVQVIPFTLLHFEYADVETVSCIVSGIVWGYICYRGNSFWPAALMHIGVNVANRWFSAG